MREEMLIKGPFPESVYLNNSVIIKTFKHGKVYQYDLDYCKVKSEKVKKRVQEFFYWTINNCSEFCLYPYYNTYNRMIDYMNSQHFIDSIDIFEYDLKSDMLNWWVERYGNFPIEYHRHFIVSFSCFIHALNKSNYNEYDLDVWDIRRLGIKINQKPTKECYRFDFSFIKSKELIDPVKEYIYKKITSYEKITTTKVRLISLKPFFKVLSEEGVCQYNQLTREHIKKYITVIRKTDFKVYTQNKRLRNVSYFIGFLIEENYIADLNYFTSEDFLPEPNKNKHVKFSPKTMEAINHSIKLLKPNEQRMLFLLKCTGLRPIDIDTLEIANFKKLPDSDDYYLEIKQQKQNSFRTRILSQNEVNIIQMAIEESKRNFGEDSIYIFQDKNRFLEIENVLIKLNRIIKDLDLRDENNKLVHLAAYDFRKNLASTLAASDFTPLQVGYILGHKNLQSLHYYLDINTEKTFDDVIKYLELFDNLGNESLKENIRVDSNKRVINGFCNLDASIKCDSGNKCISCPLFRERTLDESLEQIELQINDVKTELHMAELNKSEGMKTYCLDLLAKLERKRSSLLACCS